MTANEFGGLPKVSWRNISITLIDRAMGAGWPVQASAWAGIFPACHGEALPTAIRSRVLSRTRPFFPFRDPTTLFRAISLTSPQL